MQIHDLARLAGVENLSQIPLALAECEPIGFSIDSRSVRAGELFFAIHGEVFDGHTFVKSAFEQGACAAIVAHDIAGLSQAEQARCLLVPDTLKALQELSHQLLKQWGRPIIAITGSMGKTTTKELTARVVGTCGRVHKSVGNLNNAYGLPLTVLKMISDGSQLEDFDFAVLEMGMSYPGEITRLCEIAPPNVSVVINVAPVHLENFESVEGIAAAKAEIIQGLVQGGLAVLNQDDPRASRMATLRTDVQVVSFGRSELAQVKALNITSNGLLGSEFTLSTPQGSARVKLPLPGEHLIYNALAAAAVGLHVGATPEKVAGALATAQPAYHRGEILNFREGFTIVDDTYNSNPLALQEMTRLLAAVQGAQRTVLVAGEMLELGPEASELHFECGKFAAEQGIGLLIGVRGRAQDILRGARETGMPEEQIHFAEGAAQAGSWLATKLQAGDVVLVKGSRGVKTEGVIEVLKQQFSLCEKLEMQTAYGR